MTRRQELPGDSMYEDPEEDNNVICHSRNIFFSTMHHLVCSPVSIHTVLTPRPYVD